MFSEKNLALAEELIAAIKFFNQQGWTPATSTNYSVRSKNPQEFIISRSGVDKSQFTIQDLIVINAHGEILAPRENSGVKSSAETEIHTALYQRFPEVNCVLHTHSALGTVWSKKFEKEGLIRLEGWEILKAFEGNNTHDLEEVIPVVPNSQHIPEILASMGPQFVNHPKIHGFLISGHGLYTWGKDIATAKRHIEAYEFLFECMKLMRSL